jgi:hypothetical protein
VNKDLRKLFKALEAQGYEVRLTPRGNHYIVTRNGRRITTIAGTPSDHRAWQNMLSYLKRDGFKP